MKKQRAEKPLPKNRPRKRVGSGRLVRVRASSANELLGTWELRRNEAIKAKDSPATTPYRDERHHDLWLVRETAINECIEDFRRLLAHPMKRQPDSNTDDEPDARGSKR